MPWNAGQGKFIRANPDFSGETVWQQDQQATIKIIAARHDSHDQDIADGISQCININGITAMLASLDLNSNKIINLADGVDPGDGANMSQLATLDTDLKVYIDAGDQAQQDYTDNQVIASTFWNPATNVLTLTKGDATTLNATIDDFTPGVKLDDIRASGVIKHASQVFTEGAVVVFQALSSSRWTFAHDGASTMNFVAPTGIDDKLGEDYEVEGTVLITNGAAPGALTLQISGSPVDPASILGSPSGLADAKYLLSYIIHRSAGDAYDYLFIWSAVT